MSGTAHISYRYIARTRRNEMVVFTTKTHNKHSGSQLLQRNDIILSLAKPDTVPCITWTPRGRVTWQSTFEDENLCPRLGRSARGASGCARGGHQAGYRRPCCLVIAPREGEVVLSGFHKKEARPRASFSLTHSRPRRG
jgi:hypothetical protein